jgi:hypothetical protein
MGVYRGLPIEESTISLGIRACGLATLPPVRSGVKAAGLVLGVVHVTDREIGKYGVRFAGNHRRVPGNAGTGPPHVSAVL